MAERHVADVAVASSSLAFRINYKKVYKSYDQNSILLKMRGRQIGYAPPFQSTNERCILEGGDDGFDSRTSLHFYVRSKHAKKKVYKLWQNCLGRY